MAVESDSDVSKQGPTSAAPELPTRDRWPVCFAASSRDKLESLAERIEDLYDVRDLRPSAAGLGMLSLRDSVREEAFHLGEFSLATSSVRLTRADGATAFGGAALMCDEKDFVRAIAMLDAVLSENWDGSNEAAELLRTGQQSLDQVSRTRKQIMDRTSVDFSTLDQDA